MGLCEYNNCIKTRGHDMEETRVRKRVVLLRRIKWLGLLFGLIMYYVTVPAFGDIIATILACAAASAFYIICDRESKATMCEHVSQHLHDALIGVGQKESVFEIKAARPGLIIRVYLIRAHEKAPLCTKVLLHTISESWYRSGVWVTQIADLNSENEIEEAQQTLNDELLEDLRKPKA